MVDARSLRVKARKTRAKLFLGLRPDPVESSINPPSSWVTVSHQNVRSVVSWTALHKSDEGHDTSAPKGELGSTSFWGQKKAATQAISEVSRSTCVIDPLGQSFTEITIPSQLLQCYN